MMSKKIRPIDTPLKVIRDVSAPLAHVDPTIVEAGGWHWELVASDYAYTLAARFQRAGGTGSLSLVITLIQWQQTVSATRTQETYPVFSILNCGVSDFGRNWPYPGNEEIPDWPTGRPDSCPKVCLPECPAAGSDADVVGD
jgi:hypothetical protein